MGEREEEKRRWNDDVTVDGLRPNFKGAVGADPFFAD